MDTSCQPPEHMQDLCMSVLTEIKSPFQAVMPTQTVLCSATLRPAALVLHALLMILSKNSIVLFAQSKNLGQKEQKL